MVVLANSQSGSSEVIYSGLIAAFVSGVVSIIGYCINVYSQNKNNKETIETQKEIAEQNTLNNLIYKIKIEEIEKLRSCVTEYISIIYNIKIEKSKMMTKRKVEKENDGNRLKELYCEEQKYFSLINLYFYHKNIPEMGYPRELENIHESIKNVDKNLNIIDDDIKCLIRMFKDFFYSKEENIYFEIGKSKDLFL